MTVATSHAVVGAPAGVRYLVSDLEEWWIVTKHQLRHYLRTNRFLGLLGFVFVVSALTLTFQISVGIPTEQLAQLDHPAEYICNFLGYAPLWIILAAAFFGGDALSVDFSSGAGYYMLVLPIRRSVLLLGRYTAAAIATFAIVGLYYGFAIVGGAYFFSLSSLPWWGIGQSLAAAGLFTLATLSVAFCVSAFIRSPVAGVLITILGLYVVFAALGNVTELANFEPWFSLNYAGGAIYSILDTDFIHRQLVPLGAGQYYVIWTATVQEGLAIMAGYVAVFLPLSVFLYYRKESSG